MSRTSVPVERIALIERHGEQHRESGLIELQAYPVGLAAEPLVLVPVPVGVLRGEQIAQRVARFARAPTASSAPALSTRSRGHTR